MRAPSLALLAALIAVAGCGRSDAGDPIPDDAAALAAVLHERYGAADELTAEIYLLVAPPDTDHVSFSLQFAIDPERGVVLDAFKKGFEILDGHLDPTGGCLLVLQREDYAVRGNLDAIAAERQAAGSPTGLFVTQLPRLVDELRIGPIPRAERYAIEAVDGAVALRCIAAEGEALCVLDEAGERVEEKILYRGHGDGAVELLRLRYSKHLVIDGLLRPRLAQASLPGDETRIVVKLAKLERPEIGKPLAFTIPTVPEGWPVRPLGLWLDDLSAARAEPEAEPDPGVEP